jgi:hypothetical protein
MAVRETPAARMLLRFEPGWVQMHSRKAGTGRARVQLPLPLAGGRVEIALNPYLLVELLRLFRPDDLLLLGLTSSTAPAVFSDGYNYTHVLSPCLDADYRRQSGLTTPG